MKGSYLSGAVWRNAVLAAVEMGSAVAGQAVLYYFMARRFGPADFGVVTLATAIVSAAGTVASFGSVSFVMQAIASRAAFAAHASNLLITFQWANAAAVLPALAVALWLWPTSFAERAFILVMLALVPAECVSATVRSGFYGRERFTPVAALNTAASAAALAVGLACLHAGVSLLTMGLVMAALSWMRAAAAVGIYTRMIGPLRPAPLTTAYSTLFRPALPFFAVLVLSLVHMRAAVVIVRWLLGPEKLGIYGVAATAIGAASLMIQPLTTSLFPSVAQQTGAASSLDSRRALRTLVMPFAAGLACAAAISALARPAVTVFLDSSYSGSVGSLRILAWFLPMIFVSSTALRMLMACGRAGTAVRILALNCAANITANLVLVPVAGIEGAALSALLSGALSAIQSVAALRGTT